MFRHGERTLRETYPNNKYFHRVYWPEGYNAFLNVIITIYHKIFISQHIMCDIENVIPLNYYN